MSEKKLRYVHVGTGQRSWMYITALVGKHADVGELCAICDTNQSRMDYWNKYIAEKYNHPAVPTYKAADFDRMIAEQKPDKVIVTSVDRTHHKYICRAMELGCDVITEKPMTPLFRILAIFTEQRSHLVAQIEFLAKQPQEIANPLVFHGIGAVRGQNNRRILWHICQQRVCSARFPRRNAHRHIHSRFRLFLPTAATHERAHNCR